MKNFWRTFGKQFFYEKFLANFRRTTSYSGDFTFLINSTDQSSDNIQHIFFCACATINTCCKFYLSYPLWIFYWNNMTLVHFSWDTTNAVSIIIHYSYWFRYSLCFCFCLLTCLCRCFCLFSFFLHWLVSACIF